MLLISMLTNNNSFIVCKYVVKAYGKANINSGLSHTKITCLQNFIDIKFLYLVSFVEVFPLNETRGSHCLSCVVFSSNQSWRLQGIVLLVWLTQQNSHKPLGNKFTPSFCLTRAVVSLISLSQELNCVLGQKKI